MEETTPQTPSLGQYFSGRNVLVTGGGQGVGRALEEQLYSNGANVFVLERDAGLVAKLKENFAKVRAEVCDITEWERTQKIIESFGSPMHHLVNCAAVAMMVPFLAVTEEHYTKQMDVNLKRMYCVSQAVSKGMIAANLEGCTIVNVASIASILATNFSPVYCISKAGVAMLTKSMAVELGPHKIRVNVISTTGVETPMLKQLIEAVPAGSVEGVLKRQPLHGEKTLKADEVANSILFLLSPLSSMTTGHNLVVDGGICAC